MITKDSIKVDFIYVGQGDCITINWIKNDGSEGLGIVDCANFNLFKPWMETHKPNYIDFVLLSHPHSDHFYGIDDLINYCDVNEITIENIYFTFNFHGWYMNGREFTPEEWIKSVVNEKEKRFKLAKLLEESVSRHVQRISELRWVDDTSKLRLNSNLMLEFLAPNSFTAKTTYLNQTFDLKSGKKKKRIENKFKENPSANIFSSAIAISAVSEDKKIVLLTSDITTNVKERIFEKKINHNDNIYLIQVPHHGSKNGFSEKTLDNFEKSEGCFAVVSVGPNSYNHPNIYVTGCYKSKFRDVLYTYDGSDENFNQKLSNLGLLSDIFSNESGVSLKMKSFLISENECSIF